MMVIINGRLQAVALKSSAIGVRLRAGAANSATRLSRDFEKHFGKPLRATDGYRTYAIQERIFRQRYRPLAVGIGPFGDVRWWQGRRWVRVTGAAAAVPGTSNHGLGLAVDFASGINTSFSSPEYLWMAQNAPSYGWTNTEGRAVREPWHWVYNSKTDRKKAAKPKGLKVDGLLGAATYRAWQNQLGGLAVDGVFGPVSVRRLQTRLNAKSGNGGFKLNAPLKVDGDFGKRTVMAIQKLINAWAKRGVVKLSSGPLKVDGILGPRTIKALQKTLNANLWK